MKKTALFFIGIIIVVFLTSTAWAGADITGFDDYKWGTKQSVIQKATGVQPKKQLYDHVSTIYQYYTKEPGQDNRPQRESATYVFCGEEELCAGRIKLRLKAGVHVYALNEKRIRAILGDKYGYRNSSARISDNQWDAKSGGILIESINSNFITIWYSTPNYYTAYRAYEQDIAVKVKKNNLTTGFKF